MCTDEHGFNLMKSPVNKPVITPKHGNESFITDGKNSGLVLNDFWQWNVSDLLNNLTRGHVAEFIVAKALGVADGVRDEWAPYDLETSEAKIEVKSAAYLQSWPQDDYSKIQFSVRKTKELDWEKGGYRGIPKRHADVYVFALLAHKKEDAIIDKRTVNPLDLSQWEFYVLSTDVLNKRDQDSITLQSLQDCTKPVTYSRLADSVRAASK